MRKPHRFFSLKRPKLRQSWNKHNLYNLYRLAGREPPIRGSPTFFQQKWAAKSKTRAYHGEHIPEKKWVRLFSRRLLSAVEMPPAYLAAHDGSEQAAGRGSGLTTTKVTAESYSRVPRLRTEDSLKRGPPFGDVNKLLSDQFPKMTPYMQMTFAPLERRLDTAVFRALFASSVRQARQFVIHGAVKVNGKKMVHPAYQLNPGDMFQVDTDKVLYGTGVQKAAGDQSIRRIFEEQKKWADTVPKMVLDEMAKEKAKEMEEASGGELAAEGEKQEQEAQPSADAVAATDKTEAAESESEGSARVDLGSLSIEETWRVNQRFLKHLVTVAKRALRVRPDEISAKDKVRLRMFRVRALRFLSQPEDSTMSARSLVKQLREEMGNHCFLRRSLQNQNLGWQGSDWADYGEAEGPNYSKRYQMDKGLKGLSEKQKARAERIMGRKRLTTGQVTWLGKLLRADEENPVDPGKPYATPWRPRSFMSAFAFIPRYLEVNPYVCAAVYLRHPVARRGMAEVPTPFSYLTSQLAHNWYLRRR